MNTHPHPTGGFFPMSPQTLGRLTALAMLLQLPATANSQVTPATGGAQPPASAPTAPAYTPVRFDEDYRYLRNPGADAPRDLFDPIKDIQLSDDGSIYLELGGQLRYRYELFNDASFGTGPQDRSGYHLGRALVHADLHVGEHLRGFVQLKSAGADGRDGGDRPVIDEDDFDIEQAFADVVLPVGDEANLTLRAGRQNLLYGAQRLISPLDWTNTRRTFDAAKFSLQAGAHTFDGFVSQVVIVDEGPINEPNDDQTFAGLYDTIKLPDMLGEAGKLEVYALYLDRDDATFAGVTDTEERYTVGGRISGTPKPWDYDLELAYQFGEFADDDISAWMVAAEVGYRFADAALSPRVFLGLDAASGDSDPTDGDVETFNQLYPLGHAYFGYIDVIGRQNIIDVHPGAVLTLAKGVTLRGDYHLFWRQSDDDAVYNAAGGVLRADGGSDERFIGSEVDVLLNWQVDRHLLLYAGYSHFFADDFIEDTGPGEDIDFVYAAVQYTF